jgi:uncharacterized protein YqhQ
MTQRLRQFARLAASTQLLPVLESGDDPLIGGQAVLEGVMMRAPHSYCISVRRPNGEIVRQEGTTTRLSETSRIFRLPLLRGLGTLGQAMSLGLKALRFSANESLEKEGNDPGDAKSIEIPGWMMALNIVFSLAFFIFLYKFLPLAAATQIQERFAWAEGQVVFSLIDGVIRLAIFLTFLTVISRMPDISRVFMYHGAEHKVVFNYESRQPLSIRDAQSFTTFHPRCGTSFLMVVMLISIAAYAVIPFQSFAMQFASRLVLLPVIAGLSYEVIRFAAKRQGTLWASMVAPGLWLQRITTKEPTDDQVEVSIHALQGAMSLEEKQQGELIVA